MLKTNLKTFPEASELSSLHKTLNSYQMLCYKYERIEKWKEDFEAELQKGEPCGETPQNIFPTFYRHYGTLYVKVAEVLGKNE